MKKIISFVVVGGFLQACSHVNISSRPDLMTTKVGKMFGSTRGWLNGASEWHVNSPEKPYSIRVDSDLLYRDEPSLRFELRHGDAWIGPKGSKTFRAELVPSTFPPAGSVRYYGCSIFIPKDFPIEDNRLVLLQWWPETKSELGEVGRSPSLAVRYAEGLVSISIRHSPDRVVKDADRVSQEKIFKTDRLMRGKWNRFAFQVKWSFENDGMVKVWWNDKAVASYEGPVGYNDDKGPLFKFGLYRDDSEKTYVVFFSDCRESDSPRGIVP